MKNIIYAILVCLVSSPVLHADDPAESAGNYPTEAARVPLVGQIFSSLTREQAKLGVPDIRLSASKRRKSSISVIIPMFVS